VADAAGFSPINAGWGEPTGALSLVVNLGGAAATFGTLIYE
jgi:hypothetical protein